MLNTKSFLTIDFGAGNLKLAEFEINEVGGLRLKNFFIKPLGSEGAQEATREKAISTALQQVIEQNGIKSKKANVCAPGFHVFSKFVKLPPVDSAKVGQIIQYEAQQNVPFPLSEVVWDYQILGSAAGGELEVLLVAIKSEIVEGLFRVTEQAKLQLSLCDASPAALCNAFKYNYGDLENECTMLLDIGAKTSNLLFFEKGKVFSRSINLGANAITQDFSNEAKLKFEDAEKIKIAEGFVSLGGAYEEPEGENQKIISKVARQFMTKLHIQVNQTLQFYRGQQGGSAPQRLFLSGGASIMPYTAQFFAEKLNVPVEYFNPFRNVQIDPAVNLEELSRVANALGEVVGLGLRNLANCPVELNLMPESTLRWQAFNQKKPYFFFTLISLVAVTAAVGFLFQKLAESKERKITELEPQAAAIGAKSDRFKQAYNQLQKTRKEAEQYAAWMQQRFYWGDFLADMRQAFIRAEDDVRKKLATEKPNVQAGIWIDQMISNPSLGAMTGTPGMAMPGMPAMPSPDQSGAATAQSATNSIILVCRAVSLTSVDSSANTTIAYAVENEIKNSPLVDAKATQLSPNISPEDGGTFTFTVNVVPVNPPNF